jgi:hypothetical protein
MSGTREKSGETTGRHDEQNSGSTSFAPNAVHRRQTCLSQRNKPRFNSNPNHWARARGPGAKLTITDVPDGESVLDDPCRLDSRTQDILIVGQVIDSPDSLDVVKVALNIPVSKTGDIFEHMLNDVAY